MVRLPTAPTAVIDEWQEQVPALEMVTHDFRRSVSNVAGVVTLIPTVAAILTLVRTLRVGIGIS